MIKERTDLEGNLGTTSGTAYVKAIDCNGIIFLIRGLFPRIELATSVYELAARGTLHAEGSHETDSLEKRADLLASLYPLNLRRIEVRRVVLGEDFALRHGDGGWICWLVSRVRAGLRRGRGARRQWQRSREGVFIANEDAKRMEWYLCRSRELRLLMSRCRVGDCK